MAGEVRQPIDIKALEKYIDQNVPQIKTPVDLKQVRQLLSCRFAIAKSNSSDSGNRTQHIRLQQRMDRSM